MVWTVARCYPVGVVKEMRRWVEEKMEEGRERGKKDEEKWREKEEFSVGEEIVREQVTHLQCTPSMAKMMGVETGEREGMGRIQELLIGGEAFPESLWSD